MHVILQMTWLATRARPYGAAAYDIHTAAWLMDMVRPDKDIRAKESLFRSKSTADGQPRASFTPRISFRSR